MPLDFAEALAQRLTIAPERVRSALELLEAGLCPVFVAHYRRAATGGMDEDTLLRLREARQDLADLDARRREARALAEQQNALTDALADALDAAQDAETLEDLVRPIRPKRRTAAQVAAERGLGPLAEYVRHAPADGPDLRTKAAEFVDPAREVRSADEAMTGAAHILAERVADAPAVRRAVRDFVWKRGKLVSRQAGPHARRNPEFRLYFDYREPLTRIPPHRVLAINRGQRAKVLRVTVTVPFEELLDHVLALASGKGHRFADFLRRVVADALRRLVLPAVDRRIRERLTERAERHAIEVFVENLRSLLMAKPVRGRTVLALQPGYRTGCKAAVLDSGGGLLAETILYPLQPQRQWDEGRQALAALVTEHGVETIAIGNGTGCREVEALVSEAIEQHDLQQVLYAVVSEAGAAAWADSQAARDEFPRLEPAILSAVSIGRRLQDPLAELVKIDPRAIGVGLYQHDVDQRRLEQALADTLTSCVAAVGADANTASPHMLRWVPGLGPEQVEALVARRAQAPLATRADLADLPGWDEQTFLQAAGFLRVHGPNPIDVTRIHPERYGDAERLLAHLGYRTEDLASPETAPAVREALAALPLEEAARTLDMPLPVLQAIVGALQRPDHDPRQEHHGPILRRRIRRIEDLTPGEWVKGTVRNVVDFGAFVDIGLKEEGLVHVSEFSRRYVRNPLKFLHVGDVVRARIVKVDTEKHRISLSLVPEKGGKRRGPPKGDRKPGKGRPAPKQTGDRRPAESRASDDDRPRAAGRTERRAGAGRGTGERGGRRTGGRDRQRSGGGPPRGRGPRGRDRDRRRSGPPRVVTSQSDGPTPERPPDTKGRPKIRWAYYDSDSPDEHPGTEYLDEFREYEEIQPETETQAEAQAEVKTEAGQAETEPPDAPADEPPAEERVADEAPAEGHAADEATPDEGVADEAPREEAADGTTAVATRNVPEHATSEAPEDETGRESEDDSGIAPIEEADEAPGADDSPDTEDETPDAEAAENEGEADEPRT
ncbi:MAG: Tex-like N-terminal domain-containing protein [Phycisphaerae bacterium]